MIVHMGGSGRPSITDAVIDLAREHPTWYLIDSEADYRQVLSAVQALGADRVCYGSDTPFCPRRSEFGLRGVIYQDLRAADRAKVMGDNIARMLGIES